MTRDGTLSISWWNAAGTAVQQLSKSKVHSYKNLNVAGGRKPASIGRYVE